MFLLDGRKAFIYMTFNALQVHLWVQHHSVWWGLNDWPHPVQWKGRRENYFSNIRYFSCFHVQERRESVKDILNLGFTAHLESKVPSSFPTSSPPSPSTPTTPTTSCSPWIERCPRSFLWPKKRRWGSRRRTSLLRLESVWTLFCFWWRQIWWRLWRFWWFRL